jgi:hypothetical protein
VMTLTLLVGNWQAMLWTESESQCVLRASAAPSPLLRRWSLQLVRKSEQ